MHPEHLSTKGLCLVQENVVQSEALARAVKLLSASSGELRCAAIWALANMTHEASPPVCKAVLAAVPWPLFAAVLSDADTNVQVSCRLLTASMYMWACASAAGMCRCCSLEAFQAV